MPTLHDLELRTRASREHLDLFFRILYAIDRIFVAMQPQNRAFDIAQSPMEPVPIPQIDSRFTHLPPAHVTSVIFLNEIVPLLARRIGTILSKPNVADEGTIVVCGYEIWHG